jgi:hypothetical protein
VKESDRVATIAALLAALGVPVEVGADSLTISGVAGVRAAVALAAARRSPPRADGGRGRDRVGLAAARSDRGRGLLPGFRRPPRATGSGSDCRMMRVPPRG